jgi:hypothetical protein
MQYTGISSIDELLIKTAKELTTEKRNDLADSTFAIPGERKYPVNDKNHAQNALARVEQHGTPEEKEKVKRKVHEKFPDIGKDDNK